MPSKAIIASRRAFAEDLLPYLENIDFEFTLKKSDDSRFTDTSYTIEKGGKFYNFRTIYLQSIIEIRVHVYDHDPEKLKYRAGVEEACWVYKMPFSSSRSPENMVIDKYCVKYYEKSVRLQDRCFYCDARCKNGFRAHDKGARHLAKKQSVVADLAKAARINEDCMRHIMSYLY